MSRSESTTSDAVTADDCFDAERARAIAQLLDRRTDDVIDGRPLPLAWHFCYFLPRPAQRDIGEDGHPKHGVPASPRPGMRRMFAGGRVMLLPRPASDATPTAGPRIGEQARIRTEVIGERVRSGRSGPVQFVTTRSTISAGGFDVLVDERDIVYLPAVSSPKSADSASPKPETNSALPVESNVLGAAFAAASAARTVTIDPTLLFRFSALTYNAHRIHYDRTYAREAEGYPGLVVHGPLQALLMAETAADALLAAGNAASGPCTFEYRLVAPLFEDQGMHVLAERDGATETTCLTVNARVMDDSGRETARAELTMNRS
jgi:3-methylfumaryl-CoA hydratase